MCGLAITGPGAAHEAVASLIRHRGVRSSTMELPGGVMMTHARLPIVGLGEEFDQPVHLEELYYLMFVGELLDFRDHMPDARCDLELVSRTWVEEGPEGFREFDGFWSVVTYDQSNGLTWLLCDYLGQKPLYYRTDLLCAASEPQAAAAAALTTPDELYLSDVVKWGYCPDPQRTPHLEVRRVLPGELVALNHRGRAVSCQIVDPLLPVRCDSHPHDRLRRELKEAVKRRVLSSDVPVACLLSGGLDSSIIFELARRHGPVVSYYVSDGNELGEGYARQLTDDLNLTSWEYVPVGEALRIMGEPLDLGSLVPQVALARAVEERVCLTGDGADELFGGYGRAQRYDSQTSDVFRELVCWHLPRLDRVMMSERVEVRSPFLARRVCELALGLPRELRRGKRILRDLFRDELPADLADQPKKPLRTSDVERDREAWSASLVEKFRRTTWG